MKFDPQDIYQIATPKVTERGRELFAENGVQVVGSDERSITGKVADQGTLYTTKLVLRRNGGFDSQCTCSSHTICEHAAALFYKTQGYEEVAKAEVNHDPLTWKEVARIIRPKRPLSGNKAQQKLIFCLILRSASWAIGPYKAFIKGNGEIGQMVALSKMEPSIRDLAEHPDDVLLTSYFLAGMPAVLGELGGLVRTTTTRRLDYGDFPGRILDLLRGRTVYLINDRDNSIEQELHVAEQSATLQFALRREDATYQPDLYLSWGDQQADPRLIDYILTKDPTFVVVKDQIVAIEPSPSSDFLRRLMEGAQLPVLTSGELNPFLEKVLPDLTDFLTVQLPDHLTLQSHDSITAKRVYLREEDGKLYGSLKVAYGPREIIPCSSKKEKEFHRADEVVLSIDRDLPAEEAILVEFLGLAHLTLDAQGGFAMTETLALDWMLDVPPKLLAHGYELRGESDLKRYRVTRFSPKVSLSISSGIDWFELEAEIIIGEERLRLKDIRKMLRAGGKFVELSDGSHARLPEEWLERFKEVLNFGQAKGEKLVYQNYHITLMDELMAGVDSVTVDEAFRDRRERLRQFKTIHPIELPEGLNGELRPYQKSGLDWLCFLNEFSFGGCLADDMGLGKTIQTLALLLREKQARNPKATLIVAPTSVVFNWEREVEKFAPQLKVLTHTGQERTKDVKAFDAVDVVLTTYGIMRRDADSLKEYQFHYIILDESQFIKNPISQTAKAARSLQANNRLALTGTPVENHTIELWSQFSFLNPGLLGSMQYFQRRFAKPIEKHADTEAADKLRKLVNPFILRRTKKSVAQDLPAKTENISYCTMNDEQHALYNHWRDHYRDVLLAQIDSSGLNQARIKILEGLLRLRQICCHPSLVDKTSKVDSGKMEVFLNLVEEILSEDHKILIFSQFVQMLQIVRKEMKKRKINFEYLDGSTRNRKEHIDNFQENDEVRVFLISLKAGGAGLNLTAADYVIHYDPWWNPAVEEQATDRSYRIGQTRPVFTYKLITRNSVEEKILQLQDRKRDLVEKIIATDATLMKSLTRADVELLFS